MRRIRITLWIAVLEGLIVAFTKDLSRWTVIGLAIPVLALYIFWGREARSHTVRQVLWIAAASQALAVVVVILAFILNWLALLLAAIFAAIALLFLFWTGSSAGQVPRHRLRCRQRPRRPCRRGRQDRCYANRHIGGA